MKQKLKYLKVKREKTGILVYVTLMKNEKNKKEIKTLNHVKKDQVIKIN